MINLYYLTVSKVYLEKCFLVYIRLQLQKKMVHFGFEDEAYFFRTVRILHMNIPALLKNDHSYLF